jgi:hypothetical protein
MARTKHINVCYHNSRNLQARKIVDYSYVHTNQNVADILTKALTKDKHKKFTKPMRLVLAMVPDSSFGSGTGSEPNRCQFGSLGRHITRTVNSGTVRWKSTTRLNRAGCQRVVQWVHV